MRDYHDREWGVPLHDDRALFEFLCLEGAQAGLSWRTVLDKRAAYRKAFATFDIAHCARLSDTRIDMLMTDAGIIRNRRKIVAVRDNARAALLAIEEFGDLDAYLWSFVDDRPIRNHWRSSSDVPAMTAVSAHMSRELRRRGFRFVGPTICYAFMQATGMINDHTIDCFRHQEIAN
jgi:DNA-3-methyladenine glycosylase I